MCKVPSLVGRQLSLNVTSDKHIVDSGGSTVSSHAVEFQVQVCGLTMFAGDALTGGIGVLSVTVDLQEQVIGRASVQLSKRLTATVALLDGGLAKHNLERFVVTVVVNCPWFNLCWTMGSFGRWPASLFITLIR